MHFAQIGPPRNVTVQQSDPKFGYDTYFYILLHISLLLSYIPIHKKPRCELSKRMFITYFWKIRNGEVFMHMNIR